MGLKEDVQALAVKFADGVLAAIRGSSVGEILDVPPQTGRPANRRGAPSSRPGRPVAANARGEKRERRSDEQLDAQVVQILSVLKKEKSGLRSEQLRAQLGGGMTRERMARPIKRALSEGKIKKTGEKRETVYSIA